MVFEIKTLADFKSMVSEAPMNKIIVIDFYADWCGPCKRISPELDKLDENSTFPNVSFFKINTETEEMKDVCTACKIAAMPTFCFFHGGKYVDEFVGANLDALIKKITTFSTTLSTLSK